MAEILLEGRDCEACGTEVRKGAIFCYHCGESVAPDVAVTTDTGKEKVSDAWFREDVTAPAPKDEKITDDSEIVEETDESEIIEDADDSETIEETDETEIVEDDSEIIEKTDKSEVVEEKTEETEIVEDEIIEDDAEAEVDEDKSLISEDDKKKTEEKDTDTEKEEKPKLKSAATMRRKPKRIQKKRVEIVWDEPQSPPNIWFLIATILFAILAVGLWFVARYLG